MRKTILVQERASGQKGYIHYDSDEDLGGPELQVMLLDKKGGETGEHLMCAPKDLIAIGHRP